METRITSDNNINYLKQALLAVDWFVLQSSPDVISAYELLLSNCLEIYNLSKAFDIVDHKLLLRKMEHYCVRGSALLWLTLY